MVTSSSTIQLSLAAANASEWWQLSCKFQIHCILEIAEEDVRIVQVRWLVGVGAPPQSSHLVHLHLQIQPAANMHAASY